MLGVQSVVHNYGHGGSGITVFQVKLEIMLRIIRGDLMLSDVFRVVQRMLWN